MALTVMGITRDMRTNTPVVYAKMGVTTYLEIVGDDFENFQIQRRRESHKAYQRLKQDLIEGALLPSISLAVKPTLVPDILPLVETSEDSGDMTPLEARLSVPDAVDILDGLQRTYILSDIQATGHEFVDGQEVLAEFWLEGDLKNLIYRIIVLNAGQKPMSMRHQIELLFMSLRSHLVEQIDGLEIYTERDNARRRSPKKFALSLIASGYHAFLTGSAELQKDNIVATKLMDSNALDASEEELGESYDRFVEYLETLCKIDEQVFRIYNPSTTEEAESDEAERLGFKDRHWLADENVFLSFFAAVAQFGNLIEKRTRIEESLGSLLNSLTRANAGDDPLALERFDELKKGTNPRKSNVGVATRRLITNGFKEFFRESGELPLERCWDLAAD